jgi:hypothetical protein
MAQAQAPLFSSDTVLDVSIRLDFDDLCNPRETEDCDYTPTSLEYTDVSGQRRTLPVAVRIRGGWRSLSRNCSAPLLWVRFDEQAAVGTVFEGQSQLPLTTHCGKGISLDPTRRRVTRTEYEQYLLREYLGHRLYQQVTEFAVGARLVHIRYPDPAGSDRGIEHYAFFTEHFNDLAARTGSRHLVRGSFDPDRLDPQASATLALFQFMIGNTDWSIVRERNTALFLKDGRQIPVPYDLDMSGLVDAVYAGPAPGLPIDDVRQRYFLGYCQPGTDWDSVFAIFDEKRPDLLALPEDIPGLSRRSRRTTTRFLEEFFDIIAQPEARTDCIVGNCQPWPPDREDHTSPPAR